MPEIVDELLNVLGPDVVTVGDAVDRRYFCDWSAIDPARPRALLRPRNPREVATAVRLAMQPASRSYPKATHGPRRGRYATGGRYRPFPRAAQRN